MPYRFGDAASDRATALATGMKEGIPVAPNWTTFGKIALGVGLALFVLRMISKKSRR